MKKGLAIQFTCKIKELKGFVDHYDALFGISRCSGNLEAVGRACTTPPALCCAFATPEVGR